MRFSVSHVTEVGYAAPVRFARFNLRLRPAAWPGQRVEDHALRLDPGPAQIVEGEGGYHVFETRFALEQPITRLRIESRFTVERESLPMHLAVSTGPSLTDLRERAMASPDLSALGPASYIFASPQAPAEAAIALWAEGLIDADLPVIDAGKALMGAIHREFTYLPGATFADTSVADAFAARAGVCQDFSQVMIVAARAFGIPAAYVSGYLRTLPPPGQPRLVGADAMHAWVALWCGEDLGWIGFDPTNDVLAGGDHIFVGMGRDYADVAPIDGTFKGAAQQTMTVAVDVVPLD
ncbi:transglutaminase family protein [Novosphingobium sp. 9]|uniref:transglutaminase family protein n=1 Tax=Novosphingobium sp. 9 TaxID=2025349 RepID=UPI0021B55C20|nr:transglutaminase family protein [Novosphingobium sp. 9]